MSTLSMGLLGAGRIGKVHAEAIAATAATRLVAVADAFPEPANELAVQHECDVRSVEDVITSDDVDAVLIATPTDLHAEQIEAAARVGKAIFCEKPIDLDVGRVRECLGVVAETGVPLMVGFNRRFDPSFAAVRGQIEDGAIGDVEMVTIISRDPGPPPVSYMERSGGLFKDMTIHDFDMARFLLGEEPVRVHAVGSVLVDPAIADVPDVDSAAVTLMAASGRIAQISNSRRAVYGYDQRIEVHGSSGMARADNFHRTTIEVARVDGYRRDPLMDFFLERYMPSYRAEIEAFAAAVLDGRPPAPTGDDGLQALILAEAATRSNAEGRPIDVDDI